MVYGVMHAASTIQVVNLSRSAPRFSPARVGVHLFWKGVRDIEDRSLPATSRWPESAQHGGGDAAKSTCCYTDLSFGLAIPAH
jgi:hypothetical protein